MNESLPMLKDFILPSGTLPVVMHIRRVLSAAVLNACPLMSVHTRDQNIQATALQFEPFIRLVVCLPSRSLQRAEGGSEVLWQKNINDSIDPA